MVVNIGQAGGRFAITPERVAINVDDFRIPDNEGNQPVDEPVKKMVLQHIFLHCQLKQLLAN